MDGKIFEALMYAITVLVVIQSAVNGWVLTEVIKLKSTVDDGMKTDIDRIFNIVNGLSNDVETMKRTIDSLQRRLDEVEDS